MLQVDFQRASKQILLKIPQLVAITLWRQYCGDLVGDAGHMSHRVEGIGEMPQIHEMMGEPQYDTLTQTDMTAVALPWELGLEVDKFKLKSEANQQAFLAALESIAQNFADFPNTRFFQALTSSTTNTLDKVTLINAAHPVYGSTATYSNVVSGTGTTPANIAADMTSVLALFAAMKNRAGNPIYASMSSLKIDILHPIELLTSMNAVFNREGIAADASYGAFKNVNYRTEALQQLSDIDSDDWLAILTNIPGRKPFFFYKVEDPKRLTNDSDYLEKLQTRYISRFDILPGYAQTIIKVVN